MKITICVLSHNAIEITKKFIDLLFANTENFNLVMIDNGSTDGTAEYLTDTLSMFGNPYHEEKIINLVLNKENLGVIGGRNMGFALFNNEPTDYLCFLDNDQFVQKNWLVDHINFLQTNNLDIAGVDAWLMDKKFMPRYNCKKPGEPFTYVGAGGMILKRKVVECLGGFDEQFNPAYFEDPDYNFRAQQNKFAIGWNHQAKILHLAHQTLGKNQDKHKIFKNSYEKFCNKWKDYQFLNKVQN
jgi:GT2 family glycosyltransferase